jgi:hypothetical protein
MKTQKILAGTLVAGITMFLLGWLIYGVVLVDFMKEYCTNTNARPMDQMIWWALVASNFVSGWFLTLVLYWSGSFTAGAGIKIGAISGFLIGLSFDLSMYSMTTMFQSLLPVLVDVLSYSIISAIASALSAVVMSKVGKASA